MSATDGAISRVGVHVPLRVRARVFECTPCPLPPAAAGGAGQACSHSAAAIRASGGPGGGGGCPRHSPAVVQPDARLHAVCSRNNATA